MNYLAELFHKASAGRKLTTREAAFLQALKGALIGFLAPLLPSLMPVLVGQEHIVWSGEALSTLLGAFIAFVIRLYFSQNDTALGDLAEAYYTAKTQAALTELIAPGPDPALISFTVPVAKTVAIHTKVPEPISVHDIITQPQKAIAPPAPIVPATAADRFAQQVASLIASANTQPNQALTKPEK